MALTDKQVLEYIRNGYFGGKARIVRFVVSGVDLWKPKTKRKESEVKDG